jgi:hypothetical protein
MSRNLSTYTAHQVFLNYPFDDVYRPFATAMTFGVVAAGLLPLCALDFSSPDTLRLARLVEAIDSSAYSVHDLSRARGEGQDNYARMNMPIEMGMALFHALKTQHHNHRCAFVVPESHTYQRFASDFAGLDPLVYNSSELKLVTLVYDWLLQVVPRNMLSVQPPALVAAAFDDFKKTCTLIATLGAGDPPGHNETREVMYRVCARRGWWDWRETRAGREQFPFAPIHWIAMPQDIGLDLDSHVPVEPAVPSRRV